MKRPIIGRFGGRFGDQSLGALGNWSGGTEVWNPGAYGSDQGEYYSFTFNASSVTWTTAEYVIRSRRTDSSRVEAPHKGAVYIVDLSPPESRVLVPANGSIHSNLTIMSGTAADIGPAGLDREQVAIKWLDGGTTKYWNGGTDLWDTQITPVWSTATTLGASWTYEDTGIIWTYGQSYYITSRAIDKGNNTQTVIAAGRTILIDNVGPDSQVIAPATGGVYADVASISGTSGDDYSTPIDGQMQLHRDSNNNDIPDGSWNGTGWEGYSADLWFTPANFAVLGTTATMSNNFAGSTWNSGYKYYLKIRSKDNAGSGNNQGAASPQVTFRIDKVSPWSKILQPSAPAYNDLLIISGTADDDAAGVGEVRMALYNTSQGQYYDPSASPPWVNGAESLAPWVLTQATLELTSAAWHYDFTNSTWTSGARYRVRARAKDRVDNLDVVLSTAIFQFDADAPISTCTYPVDGTHLTDAILGPPGDEFVNLQGTSYDYPLVDKSGVNGV